MAVNIGPKIGIDGEKEYRKQINELITQQKTFSAEMRELESSFDDNTSAMEKNRKKGELLEKQIANQEKTVEELEKGLAAAKDKYGENATETNKWKQAVSNAKTELNGLKKNLDKIPRSMKQVGQSMQDAGKKMQSVGSTMTKYVTAPIVAVGAASIAAWKEVDEGKDTIVKMTGATGEALAGLQDSMNNVATSIPTTFAEAGTAIGEVNTKFGLTGTELEELSGKFIKFAELNDTDVKSSVDGVQKVMAAFGVETKDAGKVLDILNKTGQDTGIDMATLESSMVKNAAALQQMGLDAYDAAGFLGQVETSGASTETVMSGLSKALINAGEDGKSLPDALAEFQGVMNSTASDQEKLTAAIQLFGKKAGPAIYEACKKGSLSFESLSTDAETYLGNVEQTFENTLDAPDQFQVALNNVKKVGSEVGETLLTAAAPLIVEFGEKVKEVGNKFSSLDEDQKKAAVGIATAFALGGPALTAIGNLVTKAGEAVTKIGELASGAAELSAFQMGGLYVGIAAAAIGTVAGSITAYESAVKKNNETLQDVISRTKTATGDLDSAIGKLETDAQASQSAIDAIFAQEEVAGELVARLEELEKQSSLTAEEQAEMEGIVKQLNTMYPELKLSIDKSTGALSKSTGEIKNYVKNASKMALIAAYTKAAEEGYTNLAEASLALKKAQDAEQQNLKDIARLEGEVEEARKKDAAAALEMGDSTGAEGYATRQANIALEEARKQHVDLTEKTEAAQAAYDTAEGTIKDYQAAAEELSTEIAGLDEEQETAVSSTEEITGAYEEASDAAEDYSKETQKASGAIEGFASSVAEAAKDFVRSTNEISNKYDETYKAARDSIDGQIGLFDEWSQDMEITAAKMLENLNSQITGMTNYNSNMAKLTKAAVDSNDPNFKAFVQAVSEMGIGAAGEVQALVDAMENDKDTFNEIVGGFDTMEGLKNDYAANTTYIANDFKTKGQVMAKAWIGNFKKIGTSVVQDLGKNIKTQADTTKKVSTDVVTATKNDAKSIGASYVSAWSILPSSARTATNTATTETKAAINGMNLHPEVKKIDVPKSTTDTAKNTMQSRLDRINGRMDRLLGVPAAASAAEKTAEANLQNISGTMTITNATEAAQKAKNAIQNLFNNNPIISWIKTKTSGGVEHNAAGGIIRNETLSWLAEGDRAEAVIPLEGNRSRAISLYKQAGQILGVSPTVSMGYTNPQAQNISVGIDTQALYAAVASGAAKGMESANVRIYWNNREAGRIMRDMGVQFA